MVKGMIDCNPVNPGINLRSVFERIHMFVHLDEHVLKQIAGDLFTRGKAIEQVEDSSAVFVVDFVKRGRSLAVLRRGSSGRTL